MMYELTEHIEYLVFQHDCVVIPGVGAIIAYHTPAYVDSERRCIFPPTRLLSFNGEITHSDGLLASSVARRECVSYDKASEMVAQSVSDMMTCLDSQNEIALGRLGVLRRNEEGSIEFVSNNVFGQTLNMSGYKPLSLVGDVAEPDERVSPSISGYSYIRRFVNIAASLILLVMLGLMLSTPIVDNEAVMASMSSFRFAQPEEPEFLSVLDSDIELSIAVPDPETSTAIVEERNRAENDGPYYIIVASLPNEANAQEFIESCSWSDEDFRILKTETRCRVYVDRATTLTQAYEARKKNGRLDKFPDIWVFRK